VNLKIWEQNYSNIKNGLLIYKKEVYNIYGNL